MDEVPATGTGTHERRTTFKDSANLPPNMRQDIFSLAEGPVTLQWPTPLSKESIEDLEDWLEILKRKIGRSGAKGEFKTQD